jgi:hypothetical protein
VDTEQIISELETERERVDTAITVLQGLHSGQGKRRGRPKNNGKGKRHLSAAARKRISDAMKKRWAAKKG